MARNLSIKSTKKFAEKLAEINAVNCLTMVTVSDLCKLEYPAASVSIKEKEVNS